MDEAQFDLKLASECAEAFSGATGVGCAVDAVDGEVYGRYGLCSAGCPLCALAGRDAGDCRGLHLYGMREAERFGGRYIYFCALGLTFLVSPIVGSRAAVAKITAGPFLMVDRADYVSCDLREEKGLSEERIAAVEEALTGVPYVSPAAASALSTLLFMSVGFLNNVSAANDMLRSRRSDYLQGQISSYIAALKREGSSPLYPFSAEQALTQAILKGAREEAQEKLNELLGGVMFSAGGRFPWIRARCYELLIMISRSAIQSGADPDGILQLNDEYIGTIPRCENIVDLSMELSEALRRYMSATFAPGGANLSPAVQKTVAFIRSDFACRVTLEDAAKRVFLSPTYLSRLFKQETGVSFTRFLNSVRVERSKKLLDMTQMRLSEIAGDCGFEDQSYFTKVFRAQTGLTPQAYRKREKRL